MCMKPHDNTKQRMEIEGQRSGRTPSAARLEKILGLSPTPRMLTPYEIDLLRKAAREVAQVTSAVLSEGRTKKQRCVSALIRH